MSYNMATRASANFPFIQKIIPGQDMSTVVARFLPIVKKPKGDGRMMIRVYSGYPGGANIMQRFSLWRGKPVDMGFSYTDDSKIATSHRNTCFLSHRKVRLLTSSYAVEENRKRKSMTGMTLIHQYTC
jgi:hypothetical protein